MSDTMFTSANDDDIFQNFLEDEKSKKAEAEARKSFAGSNFTKKEYETIKYVGLSRKHPTIVRFVGNFVEEDLKAKRSNPTDMKFMHISKIKADDGKQIFYLYLPLRSDDPETDHLMWRIIDAVYRKEWVKDPTTGKNKPVEVVKIQHPDIYELVNKGGFTEADGKWPYMYARGWRGPEMLLINCIDRRDDWCKTNKHTKLLSKSVNVTDDGKEYAEFGIPAYGFFDKLVDIRKNFKQGWEHYDVVVTKTGEGIETKNNLFNGTAFTTEAARAAKLDLGMGIPESEYKYISQEPALTNEELSYQRYNLDENFRPTSYHTINKYLGKSITKIDAALGTHFAADLAKLVEEETETWKKEAEEKAAAAPMAPAPAVVNSSESNDTDTGAPSVEPATVRRVAEAAPAQPASGLTPDKTALLKGYNELTDEEKSYIKDVIVKADGTLDHIEWAESAPTLLDCPQSQGGCGQLSPNSFTICPCCGKHFA